ncbi:MAG TPA: hypothetical protein VEL11_07940 [Candidatus Bathyarchaeia archaeon]|nr:hypothetical protein [Candidatus Bathyarchaeia archaeon]
MPRSNLAKTITLRVSLVPRLQVYHKEEIKKDPRGTSEEFGAFLNDKLEQLLDKEEYAKSNFPNCSILSISDNVIYIKDRVLKGVVEVYYMFLNDLMTSRLFCQYDQSFSCVHIVYAVATLDVAKLDPGAYKEAQDNMGQQFMKEIKEKFRRKINLQPQRRVDKRVGAAKMRDSGRDQTWA